MFIHRNLCPNGTYSLGAQIKCTLCLPGSQCPSITEGPKICPQGSFSERNSADCKLCEAGKQCADPAGTNIICCMYCYLFRQVVPWLAVYASDWFISHLKYVLSFEPFVRDHLLVNGDS